MKLQMQMQRERCEVREVREVREERKVIGSKHHLSSKNHLISHHPGIDQTARKANSKQRLYARIFPSGYTPTFSTNLTITNLTNLSILPYHPKPTFYTGTDPVFIIYSITNPGFLYSYRSCRDNDRTVGDGGDKRSWK